MYSKSELNIIDNCNVGGYVTSASNVNLMPDAFDLSRWISMNEVNERTKRQIPLKIKFSRFNKETIDVDYVKGESEYIDNAKEILFTLFTLYGYHYEHLVEFGSCGDRFYNFGRIIISKKNI